MAETENSVPFAQLSDADAFSACGPAAVLAFVRANGRNPTPREAQDLAEQNGWSMGDRG